MKTLLICVFIATCFIVKGSFETIQCYVCDDCDVLDDSQLSTCPLSDSATSKKTTTLATESTQSTDESSTLRTTASTQEIISTTFSSKPTEIITDPPTTTFETMTETSKTEPTTVRTEVTEPPITNETKPTTLSSSSEAAIPANSIPSEILGQITEEPNFQITGSFENKNPSINGFPQVFKPLLTESSEISSGITDPVEEITPSIVFTPSVTTDFPEYFSSVTVLPENSAPINNEPPSVQFRPESFQPEEVYSTVPELPQYTQAYPIFNRYPREVRNSRSASSYHCYSIEMIDGDKKKVKKGCIEVPEDKDACDVIKNEFGKTVDKCKVCTEDKCNSSSRLKLSIMTLAIVLVISFY